MNRSARLLTVRVRGGAGGADTAGPRWRLARRADPDGVTCLMEACRTDGGEDMAEVVRALAVVCGPGLLLRRWSRRRHVPAHRRRIGRAARSVVPAAGPAGPPPTGGGWRGDVSSRNGRRRAPACSGTLCAAAAVELPARSAAGARGARDWAGRTAWDIALGVGHLAVAELVRLAAVASAAAAAAL
jgi:hypothetical protein